MNIYMLQHVYSTVQYSTDNIPLSNNKCACIIIPDLLTSASETNYLMDVNADETPNRLFPRPPHPRCPQLRETAMDMLAGAPLS